MHPTPDPEPRPIDWHPQDWILVIEALCWFASDELIDEANAEDAHRLVDGITAEQGLEASELLEQADRFTRNVETNDGE